MGYATTSTPLIYFILIRRGTVDLTQWGVKCHSSGGHSIYLGS